VRQLLLRHHMSAASKQGSRAGRGYLEQATWQVLLVCAVRQRLYHSMTPISTLDMLLGIQLP
jgi:hypothetical protein